MMLQASISARCVIFARFLVSLQLIFDKNVLEFQREYILGKEPVRMELLIIKKLANVQIENEIGRIFKRYNVVEYKSPEDGLSIDDYYKTVGYACLYKGLGDMVNQIPVEELTVSIFRENYPRELFGGLRKSGRVLEERFPRIFYITGNVFFDTQVVVTSRLRGEEHSGLRILSRTAAEEDVKAFLRRNRELTNPGDRNNADAVLQVNISSNEGLYEKIRRDSGMCEALRRLMKDEIAETIAEILAEETTKAKIAGMEKGMEESMDNAMLSAIANLMDTMKWTDEQAMEAIKIPLADRGRYSSQL